MAGRNALREAVRLDSAYGLPVYYLAGGEYELIQTVREEEPRGAALADVRRLLDRAIALDSTLYGAYEIKAHLALDVKWDIDAAQRQVDALLRRNPSDAWGHALDAWLLERRARHSEAIAAMREAIALDPLDPRDTKGTKPAPQACHAARLRPFTTEAQRHRGKRWT